MLASLSTLFNVLLMIAGFGLVIVVHELGHFLAARWAGVRVHAFAVGFGSAIGSWRKGLGFRLGSSEREYQRAIARDPDLRSSLSPTEYRLNWFPFGGYVKMLGQEDLSPVSGDAAPDSFSAKPVLTRMVIISGGVVMNLILAAVLFLAAYMHGLREISPIIGDVAPGSAAQAAGLLPGDRIISAAGRPVSTFNDLRLAVAMSGKNTAIPIVVERHGEADPITLSASPKPGPDGLLQIGVGPAAAATLVDEDQLKDAALRTEYLRQLAEAGLGAAQPGMRLVAVNGTPIDDGYPTAMPLRRAIEASGGAPVAAEFRAGDSLVSLTITPEPRYQSGVTSTDGDAIPIRHIMGLAPVMRVVAAQERALQAGLLPGDIFARIGSVEWPSVATGIAEVRANRGSEIDLIVIRDGAAVSLRAPVARDGTIGFLTGDAGAFEPIIAAAPGLRPASSDAAKPPAAFPAARLSPPILPGSRIVEVAGLPVSNFRDVREAMKAASAEALASSSVAEIPLTLALPHARDEHETITLSLTPDEVVVLHALGWDASRQMACFDFATFLDRAATPWEAVGKGVRKTHQVVMMTYVTFLRLFQGSVPVDQLHGPVGITHIGSRVAEQGFVYLIFFLGLISANLAVINFLPLPIVDGGHMVFLAIEGLTRKPVSAAVQNAAIVVGLLLVGTIFIVVTFNDLVRLLG